MTLHDGWHTCLTPEEIAAEVAVSFLIGVLISGAVGLVAHLLRRP